MCKFKYFFLVIGFLASTALYAENIKLCNESATRTGQASEKKIKKQKNSQWKKVDLFDHIEIIRILVANRIEGCGSIPKVYQYLDGGIFNIYCDPANKWFGIDTSFNSVFDGPKNFPYK